MIDISPGVALLGGILSFLSPCVLPLVPPYLTYLAGTAAQGVKEQQGRKPVILAALLFVAGFSTVFVLLGATASALGQVLRAYLDILSLAAGVLIILMGLHFLGLFRLMLLYREKRFETPKPAGLWGAYLMGLAFGFGWTPCIGPVLAAILAVAGSETSVTRGMVLLGAYSLGLGLPFLFAAFAARPFVTLMAKVKHRLDYVEKAMGLLLVLTGIAFLTGWISTASFWLLETFPALGRLG